MIIVTGGAGFIGSNLIRMLNERGFKDIILVDDLTNGYQIKNLSDLNFIDYVDKDSFIKKLDDFKKIHAIFHLGACSATTEWNGKYLMENNYEYSKLLLNFSIKNNIQFIYASSASVYGLGLNGFDEKECCELPINAYAFSKLLFDKYVRLQLNNSVNSQVVGLRYFNVYGPRENHKGDMASPMYHFSSQCINDNECRLFKGTDGFLDGEQKRDFIFVDDCNNIALWFLENNDVSVNGIFNVGTGEARSFNDVAKNIIKWFEAKQKQKPKKNFIEFPEHLKGAYQNFTEANIDKLRTAGYKDKFLSLEDGIYKYMEWLTANSSNL